MLRLLLPVGSLLLSVAILLVGHGLQLTILPLRGAGLGWSAAEIGLTGAAYFLGFVAGCWTVPRMVAGVGHIRTFGVLAALASAVLLCLALLPYLVAWAVLRFATGWALSGLYTVIESWLNETTPGERRGAVVATYNIVLLLAMAAAQLLLPLSSPAEDTLFMVAAAFLCVAIIPVGLTRSIVPKPVAELRFRPRRVLAASQVAVVGAALGGMVTGSYWTLGPLYAGSGGASLTDVSVFMTAVILGGAAAQYPIGRLSDRVDRRWVLLLVLGLGGLVCAALWLLADRVPVARLPLALAFGMTSFPIYALCVAHANDNTPEGSFVEVASGILMANGVGSVIGPLLAAPLMARLGPHVLFAAAGSFLLVAFVWTALRLRVHSAARDYFQPFIPLTRTSATQMKMLLPETPESPGAEDGL